MTFLLIKIALFSLGVGVAVRIYRHKQGKNGWAYPIVSACSIGILIIAYGATFGCPGGHPTAMIIAREKAYSHAQMTILGRHVAAECPGSKILLIADPQTELSRERLNFMRTALEEGLADNAIIKASESPKPIVESEIDEMMVYDYDMTAAQFDKMLDDHPECVVVVSLIGLPNDFPKMSFWTIPPEERQALYVADGNIRELRDKITNNQIQGVITHRPDIKYDINEVIPTNTQAAFDKRYLLITPDNINDIAAKYPTIFKP